MNSTRGNGVLENVLAGRRADAVSRRLPGRIGRILDIGCGRIPRFLMTIDGAGERHGIDKNPKHGCEGISLITQDLSENPTLPFDNGYFDVVTMMAVIEHLESGVGMRLLKEAHRVLEADGLLMITTPHVWTDILLRLMAKVNLVSREEIDEHRTLFDRRSLKEAIVGSGFDSSRVDVRPFEFGMNILAVSRKT